MNRGVFTIALLTTLCAASQRAGADQVTDTNTMASFNIFAPDVFPRGSAFVGEFLFAENSIVDANCYYHLDMQADGNLVTYAGAGRSSPKWATSTNRWCDPNFPFGCIAADSRDNYVELQSDGNFVVYAHKDLNSSKPPHAWWASGTAGRLLDVLFQQTDGNVVLYKSALVPFTSQNAIWASGHTGPSGSTSPCGMTATTWHVDTNCDLIATFVGSATSNDVAGCGQLCNNTSGCTGFSYNQGTGQCTGYTSLGISPSVVPSTNLCGVRLVNGSPD
jgi:hypothetical protein